MADSAGAPFLRRFPNAAFSIVLGLGGQSVMWKMVSCCVLDAQKDLVRVLNYVFWVACLAIFGSFLFLYALKMWHHFDVCKAEWENPVRSNFFFAPGIALIVLTLGAPTDLFGDAEVAFMNLQRGGFFVGLVFQVTLVQIFYVRWMGETAHSLSTATAPFLLSTINWFFLALLGVKAEVSDLVGINAPSMLFGTGCFFAAIIYVSIFGRVHESTAIGRGHPAMFLPLTPLSVASCAHAEIRGGDFDHFSSCLLGLALVLFVVLIRSGPHFRQKPAFFGFYWAYVFPLCAMANACIAHANSAKRPGAWTLAWLFVCTACMGLVMVVCRDAVHFAQVVRDKEVCSDPLLELVAQSKTMADKEAPLEMAALPSHKGELAQPLAVSCAQRARITSTAADDAAQASASFLT